MSMANPSSQTAGQQVVDRNGLTEAEFLAAYHEKDYPKPSLTADICVFRKQLEDLRLLLIRRGGHPYLGCWALPGGFVKSGEDADTAAARELAEETGVEGLDLAKTGFYSTPGRDPRGWIVSSAYAAYDRDGAIQAGDDASEAAWFTLAGDFLVEGIPACGSRAADGQRMEFVLEHASARLAVSFFAVRSTCTGRYHAEAVLSEGLAFDHGRIIADALLALAR